MMFPSACEKASMTYLDSVILAKVQQLFSLHFPDFNHSAATATTISTFEHLRFKPQCIILPATRVSLLRVAHREATRSHQWQVLVQPFLSSAKHQGLVQPAFRKPSPSTRLQQPLQSCFQRVISSVSHRPHLLGEQVVSPQI